MQRIYSLFLLIMVVFCVAGCGMIEKNTAEKLGLKFSKDGRILMYCPQNFSGELVIPSCVEKIGSRAFFYNTAIEKVIIPEGVSIIEKDAFYGCKNLKQVVLPAGLIEIGESAFYGCVNLTDIKIPDTVRKIDNYAFYNCKSLKNIQIPDSVLSIGYSSFNWCTGLNEITIPANVNSIKGGAFANIKSVKVAPDNKYFKLDGYGALYDSNGTVILYLPPSFKGVYNIPDGVTEIGSCAFEACKKMQNVRIPASVRKISFGAFKMCYDLKKIVIPEGVREIGQYAFMRCTALEDIKIPASMENIQSGAFDNCFSLKKVSVPKKTNINPEAFENKCVVTRI